MLRQLTSVSREPAPRVVRTGMRYWIESAIFLTLLSGLAALLLAGCGEVNPQGRVPVSGEVTLDGTPVSEALLIFSPVGGSSTNASSARQENVKAVAVVTQGTFTLSQNEGPRPGVYDILIQDQPPEFEAFAADLAKGSAPRRPRFTIPKTYDQPGRLTATVSEEGPNSFQFSLESRRGR